MILGKVIIIAIIPGTIKTVPTVAIEVFFTVGVVQAGIKIYLPLFDFSFNVSADYSVTHNSCQLTLEDKAPWWNMCIIPATTINIHRFCMRYVVHRLDFINKDIINDKAIKVTVSAPGIFRLVNDQIFGVWQVSNSLKIILSIC